MTGENRLCRDMARTWFVKQEARISSAAALSSFRMGTIALVYVAVCDSECSSK